MRIEILYGKEFWDFFWKKIKVAESRIFIASPFFESDLLFKIKDTVKDDVFCCFAVRDDKLKEMKKRFWKRVEQANLSLIFIPNESFHGKIYLIDNSVIIGSQNLYISKKTGIKEGEYSVLLDFEDSTLAGAVIYKSLLVIACQLGEEEEPVSEIIFEFYSQGECPFCGGGVSDPFEVKYCPKYGGVLTESECNSYGGEGACKWCRYGDRSDFEIGQCFLCEKCGLGINIENRSLVCNPFIYPKGKNLEKVRDFLRLFNFLSVKTDGKTLCEFYEKMGLLNKIYEIEIEKLSWRISKKIETQENDPKEILPL